MDFSFFEETTEEQPAKIEEGGEGYRNIWVVAETRGGALNPASLEAMGQARSLADQIGVYLYGVVLGQEIDGPGQELFAYGADQVLGVENPALAAYQPEVYVRALDELVSRFRPEIMLLPGSTLGNDLAPRLAQRLKTGLMSHCIKLQLDMSERLLMGTFPVLGGEVYHTAVCPQARPQMATLEPGYFRIPYADSSRSGEVQKVEVDLAGVAGGLTWIDLEAKVELPPGPLSKARVVVAAGRGMRDADGFILVQKLAKALGGAIAGSRGAFDEGWVGEDQVVGVGGQSVAPELYVACGVSGDVYHTFALQGAKYIVAINPQPEPPGAWKSANLKVEGDPQQVIPALLKELAR